MLCSISVNSSTIIKSSSHTRNSFFCQQQLILVCWHGNSIVAVHSITACAAYYAVGY
jgi:hypothetical protein